LRRSADGQNGNGNLEESHLVGFEWAWGSFRNLNIKSTMKDQTTMMNLPHFRFCTNESKCEKSLPRLRVCVKGWAGERVIICGQHMRQRKNGYTKDGFCFDTEITPNKWRKIGTWCDEKRKKGIGDEIDDVTDKDEHYFVLIKFNMFRLHNYDTMLTTRTTPHQQEDDFYARYTVNIIIIMKYEILCYASLLPIKWTE
jgi:hypothetical protein